jgi:hypothetical protein
VNSATKKFNYQSEEDVKNNIIIPFFRKHGFESNDLSFEHSFILNLGRFPQGYGSKNREKVARPRYDILVTHHKKLICIVEVKNDGSSIQQRDIKQAVSYAVLSEPRAPLAIVTNGKEWRAFDPSIDPSEGNENEINLNELTFNGYKPCFSTERIYNALKYFIGYSRENLMNFCSLQIENYMKQLKGSEVEFHKRYIPSLYEPSRKLEQLFQNFLKSKSSAFVVTGESGKGKTCWICNSAIKCLKAGIPTLFFRGFDIEEGIISKIAEDLNWELTSQKTMSQALKEFSELFGEQDILVFIDGLDEIDLGKCQKVVRDFLSQTSARNVKLIVTCKTRVWGDLLQVDGVPTKLSEECFSFDTKKSYKLVELEDSQFFKMIRRYQKFVFV